MLSIPIGFDYRILGNKKVNLSVASTIQPSYIFANYSYLISTNLRNYAKAPDLNRKLNVNGAMEASLNFNSGGFKWSIGPQYRYQLMSSFKNKYPIRENLMDFGIKLGVIKTIK
jgi:oligoribonuclease NrnB/cAMP/cGMP phosphodiesterase (DHH superfamily)